MRRQVGCGPVRATPTVYPLTINGVKIVPLDAVVIGAGQAGLSASHHLLRRGVDHVVLDAGAGPGGAWRERWPTLTTARVNGVHDLPGAPLGDAPPDAAASEVVAGYFAAYEREQHLPVLRPVSVASVARQDDDHETGGSRLVVRARDGRAWAARAVLNATGTWSRPFVPTWPGATSFAGRQLHTARYPGPTPFAGQRAAAARGVLERLPVPDRVVPDGLVWDAPAEPAHVAADAILWCTGFRAALDHLAPLHLRERGGGVVVRGLVVAREPRVLLLGYGPSASTLGANRAGREAARAVAALLAGGGTDDGRGAPPGRTR